MFAHGYDVERHMPESALYSVLDDSMGKICDNHVPYASKDVYFLDTSFQILLLSI
jgi:CRISPR/Cas system CSM-associated protein Csm2 small subunit